MHKFCLNYCAADRKTFSRGRNFFASLNQYLMAKKVADKSCLDQLTSVFVRYFRIKFS